MPWVIDTADPAANRPRAANNDQTYTSRPYPSGCESSDVWAPRLLAMISRISLAASAQECAASATSEAEPVRNAAAVLASAITTFAANAINTVVALWLGFAAELRKRWTPACELTSFLLS